MKVAACDFDGTLLRGGEVSTADRAAIDEWRAAGHVFGIVTGRGVTTLLAALKRCGPVPCDFVICNNGALICDGQFREVCRAVLPEAARTVVLDHPVLQVCDQCLLFSGAEAYVLAGKAPYWIHPENRFSSLPTERARQLPLHQISVRYPDTVSAQAWAAALAAAGEGLVEVHLSSICIDMTACRVNKTEGLRRLMRIRHWEGDVLVAGDDGNDLSMIRDFGGCAVSTATDEVRRAAVRVVDSVGQMLREQIGDSRFGAGSRAGKSLLRHGRMLGVFSGQ
ncbi:HAD family hydrolase [uncultured Mailhella sp.]|uniref:HAD family hydrolase n=1 Tax=uncultured Mailhella sp. TaxID=1981031 RepID=UPI002622A10D|nr:HAD family hydrolase [uncultured Mailhella sp.]